MNTEHGQTHHPIPEPDAKRTAKIHPVVIYPFVQREEYADLSALYEILIKKLDSKRDVYSRPITVMNRQTYYNNAKFKFDLKWNSAFESFRKDFVEKYSDVIDAWSVDTCQMWLAGFGHAYDNKHQAEDVYWLIPGDFNYGAQVGLDVLKHIEELPDAVANREQDLCVGEISVPINSSKQLIDTYGTYGLLYNWFPHEAQEIRRITDKPRTEFFAIRHSFLREILRQRWYAYEQTTVILLQAIIQKKRISKIPLGDISDLPQGRDTLAAAMQQVERTERVLKLFWREKYEGQVADWPEVFRKLDSQSQQIRGAALVILQNLLPR